jgi:hypothetical protein
LATLNPALATEWHPTRNGHLKASDVTEFSNKKVWWCCQEGHEWQARIHDRSRGRDCPYCTGHRPIQGKTDLETINPMLAKEWHPARNGNLKPSDVTASSQKKVWWRCKEGHEWRTIIAGRSSGNSCPYCAGNRAIPGKTDLSTVNPALATEWHPTLNGDLKPSNVKENSNNKVWWRCIEGHVWQTRIANRSNGHNCPYCTGKLPIPGKTDLATVNPELVAEWHPTRNGNLKPSDVTARSDKKVWWLCTAGHEWQAVIGSRSKSKGSSCPYCAGNRPILGKTDLATVYPVLATEWHPTLNGNLEPKQVTAHSHKKVWRRCVGDHEWQAKVKDRSRGTNCPYCAGSRAIPGKTDLATVNPALATEWHPTLNGDLKPSDVTTNSNKRVWWHCEGGHEWEAIIESRNKGRDCPYCAEKLPIPGETDLATVNPTLATEWHSTLNGELKPTQVTANSHKKIWWRNKEGLEWQARICSRSRGDGFPYRYGYRIRFTKN